MKAKIGDRIVCQGNAVGTPERIGEIRGTGPGGQPPFQVRWSDGHESVFRPGADAVIHGKTGIQGKTGAQAKTGKGGARRR